jgi:hypothetical protein
LVLCTACDGCAAPFVSRSKEPAVADLTLLLLLLTLPLLLLLLLLLLLCSASDGCIAPVISLSKESGVADLVGPVLKLSDAQVHHRAQPWERKIDKAFFRCGWWHAVICAAPFAPCHAVPRPAMSCCVHGCYGNLQC